MTQMKRLLVWCLFACASARNLSPSTTLVRIALRARVCIGCRFLPLCLTIVILDARSLCATLVDLGACSLFLVPGTNQDEGDDIRTAQVPASWRPVIEDPETLKLFFDLFASTAGDLRRKVSVRRCRFMIVFTPSRCCRNPEP